MTFLPAVKRSAPLLAIALAIAFAVAPTAFGYSTGIHKENAPDAATFDEIGCTACHGPGASGHHDFAAGDYVSWTMVDAEGNAPAGNIYGHAAVYTVTITLDEQAAPEAANRAGFNLRASLGEFAAVDGISQVTSDGAEAAHVDPTLTSWTVTWTAPAEDEGPAIFDLFVNDVDGSGLNDAGDMVYRVGWFLTDESHAQPGAAEEEHEVHYGIALPQYWLGLIALAGMILVMLFAFVYMKYVSPHNADQKDR